MVARVRSVLFLCGVLALWPGWASAGQLQALVSPGPLSRAHSELNGLSKCAQCHEAGRGVTAERCLTCHKPIAERIARKTGVHRAVTTDCVRCHSEHGGVDADLRRIDIQAFDHAAETGYALTDRHAPLARKCAACHTTRSFLAAKPVCSTCHEDKHKPTLGSDCARCHSIRTAFKETRSTFDHESTKFSLTGAHRTVRCEKCHAAGVFRGLAFDRCNACHQTPHRRTLGPTCTTCHTTDTWDTRKVDHGLTAFPLFGAHGTVACAKCHTQPIIKPLRFDRCASCHENVHRDSIKDDCRTCHSDTSFRSARFNHNGQTEFALEGKHVGLQCRTCHKTLSAPEVPLADKRLDFSDTRAECAVCHEDTHKGKYGRLCDGCHQPASFKAAAGFVHPRQQPFFSGSHTAVTCVKCHVSGRGQPVATVTPAAFTGPTQRAKPPSTTCSTCHQDVHLGQVGSTCDRCHTIDAPKFAAPRFSHDQTAFRLVGKHGAVECAKCHKVETQAYPAATGTARRFKPTSTECRTCHEDRHLGQLDNKCEGCHTAESFKVAAYEHKDLTPRFRGLHPRLPCVSCHKQETGQFPTGTGTAIRFNIPEACITCHPQVTAGAVIAARLVVAHTVRGHADER